MLRGFVASLFVVLTAPVFVLSLFPPSLRLRPEPDDLFPAKRVVMMDNSLSSYLTINEGTDHILAISEFAQDWVEGGLLKRIYPAINRMPLTGYSNIPDPEQMLYLQADAIFTWHGAGNALKSVEPSRTIELWVDPKDPIGSREKSWRDMAKVAGKNARVEALLRKWAEKRAALKTALPQDPARQVRVALVNVNNGDWFTTNSQDFMAFTLGLAGAQNVMKRFKFGSKGDLEQLLLADPDVILFNLNPDDHSTARQFIDQPELRSLRAVREGRAYRVPLHTLMNELVEDRIILTWMAEVFYPDIMPRRLREEYRETYREVYGYSISEDEIDRAVYLGENLPSAGYKRFERSGMTQ